MTNENLTYNFIDANSVPFDFGTGWTETWDVVHPNVGNYTGRELIALRDEYGLTKDIDYSDTEELKDCIRDRMQDNHPMFNYYCDLGNHVDGQEIADEFDDTCFVVVDIQGSIGLALTGGGMDMRWEMARAFVDAGYYPPAFICNLPRMAGHHDARIINACNETLKTLADRYLRSIEDNNAQLKGVA